MLRAILVAVAVIMWAISLLISDSAHEFWLLVRLYCRADAMFFVGLVLISYWPTGKVKWKVTTHGN